MRVYIVTHKVPGYETTVCAVYATLEEAKAEADRLDAASSWATALVVEREMIRPREWTPEQRRWMRGAK
jgi:hypothetical protein